MAINTTPVTVNGTTYNEHIAQPCSIDLQSGLMTIPVKSWINTGDSAKGIPAPFIGNVVVWLLSIEHPASLDPYIAADPAGIADYTANYTEIPDFAAPVPSLVAFPAKQNAYYTWDWPTKTWILPANALSKAQADQAAMLSATCQATIFAGLQSSALGSVHTYPCKPLDQSNMSASVLNSFYPNLPAGWTTPVWCMDTSNVWTYAPHTVTQMQQAGSDVKAAIVANLTKNDSLQKQVAAATTITQVQAVIW